MPQAAGKLIDRPRTCVREGSSARGYDIRWQRARIVWLGHHPLCVMCLAIGRSVPATDVDHIVPHKGDTTLFWDRANWQSLCSLCHKVKTGRGL